ncbi:MAG: CpsD/CapB family tyrosine-protein kinase [Acidobacteriota bacterium]|jgi:capsular exopolysaccharide synthesis family protein|nr:CpsD/CapB family tyrosine-protein kinase [Acidobacteriota bacterium]NLT32780.1 CpsD/CapB family tyrosine-protein kinase [Acidobacteriota bacterium]
MSEIFDFLKKTEKERRQVILPPEPEAERPDFGVRPELVESSLAPAPGSEPVSRDVELCQDERFDLTDATPQVKTVMDPLTLIGEQFRLLRSRLGLMQKQRGIKTILVTSTVPEEGKTFTASGLIGVLAQEPGKRVLLIDADMRKPRSGINFGLNGATSAMGLSEVLRGAVSFENALFTCTNPEFSFLPSGPLPPNPSELLSSPLLEQTLKTAAAHFDWVIVDSPPVLSLSDTVLLAPLCDAVVLVVRANSTSARLVEDAVARIGKERICGVILNRQKHLASSKYYYKYYYKKVKS